MGVKLVVTTLLAALASVLPAGWVELHVPYARFEACANQSEYAWHVTLHDGEVRIDPYTEDAPVATPQLPFVTSKEMPGQRSVLKVDDGFLVADDAGEWGGSLRWFSPDGSRSTELANDNVRLLVPLPDGEVLAAGGLAHLDLSSGRVRWLRHADGSWRVVAEDGLASPVGGITTTPGGVLGVFGDGLFSAGADHRVRIFGIGSGRFSALYPNSVVVDRHGVAWAGMRHVVLRATPTGQGYSFAWLVPRGCTRMRMSSTGCHCARPPLEP